MKKWMIVVLCICLIERTTAQNVGIGTNSPHASAMLEINSANRGMLLPRVNDTSSILNPAKGLMIYAIASNRIWYFNGAYWQSDASGSDNLWVKMNDSIAVSAKKYVGINSDPLFQSPRAKFEVKGDFLVQEEQLYTRAAPTPAQTVTMSNTGNYVNIPDTDSVFRIFDPGGVANYSTNMQGNVKASEGKANQEGWKIKFNQADFGLGFGDTLWISAVSFPACRTNNFTYVTNSSVVPRELTLPVSDIFFTFRSDFAINGKGFDLIVNRLYSTETGRELPTNINASGGALYLSNGSFAAGFSSNARGYRSVAIGSMSNATNAYSLAIGFGGLSSGDNSIAIGRDNKATSAFTLALGVNNSSTGIGSISIGGSSSAKGEFALAAGATTTAKAYGSVAIGSYNDTTDNPSTFPASRDRVLQVGNGDFNNRKNALTVLRNGNVGIGVLSPHALLQFPNTVANRKIVLYEGLDNDFDFFGFGINDYILRYQVPAGGFHVFYSAANSLFAIHPNGNANLTGTLSQNSDARLKKSIAPLSDNLSRLLQLNGYSYYWRDKTRSNDEQIGLLAQEVQPLYPQLIYKDPEGMLSVNYTGLIPVLIEAIKELNDKIEKQQKHINRLLISPMEKSIDNKRKK